MTAYWINTFTAVHDDEKLAAYVALAGPAMTDAGGRFLARGTPAAVFEQATRQRTTLIAFPDVDAAVAAYHSPAYQDALRALDGGAEREIRIVEGVPDEDVSDGSPCRRGPTPRRGPTTWGRGRRAAARFGRMLRFPKHSERG